MRLIATMLCRNEAWVAGLSLRVALQWNDEVIILDHGSTDNSRQIIDEVSRAHPHRVTVLEDPDTSVWKEMEQRQRMLEEARRRQATHISIVDFDEVISGNVVNFIGTQVKALPRGMALEVPLYNLRGCLTRYHLNGIWGNRWVDLAFADDGQVGWFGGDLHQRLPLPKGALKRTRSYQQGQAGVMHLWGCDEQRLRAKHRLYKLDGRLRWPNKPSAEIDQMYSWATKGQPGHPTYGTPETWRYADTPEGWWASYFAESQRVNTRANIWQDDEVQRLLKEHGPKTFAGLDLS